MVIDTSYSLATIEERNLHSALWCRELDGFFSQVYSVNPLAHMDGVYEGKSLRGISSTALSSSHLYIEVLNDSPRGAPLIRLLKSLDLAYQQIRLMVELCRLAGRNGRDVVIRGGDPLYAGLFATVLGWITSSPVVIRVGANNEQCFRDTNSPLMPRLFRSRRLERRVERFVLSHAAFVAGANEDNLRFAVDAGAKESRSGVFRYGNLIHPVHFTEPSDRRDPQELREELGLPKGCRLCVYVGRLEAVKSPMDLLIVMNYLRQSGTPSHLIIAGDGSMRQTLLQATSKLGLSDLIHFVGNKKQEWIAGLLSSGNVVISPHTGRALAEAALAAAPVAAYDIDWQGELIRDGISGLLVPKGDPGALAQATRRLLADEQESQRLGANLRRDALRLLDPKKLNDFERDVYRALLLQDELPSSRSGA